MSGAGDAGGGGAAPVVFRKVPVGESRLWETKRIHHADLNRLHLRSIECILDPTVPADSIIGGSLGGGSHSSVARLSCCPQPSTTPVFPARYAPRRGRIIRIDSTLRPRDLIFGLQVESSARWWWNISFGCVRGCLKSRRFGLQLIWKPVSCACAPHKNPEQLLGSTT